MEEGSDYVQVIMQVAYKLCWLGYICATMEISIRRKGEIRSKPLKIIRSPVCFLQVENNEGGIASNRR